MLLVSDGLFAALGFIIALYPGNLIWLFMLAVFSILVAIALLVNGSFRRKREAKVAGLR